MLFWIIPIIILDGSWVTFIKSHARGSEKVGAHCLYKSNTAMQGCGGGWPGQMAEELALCSPCLHWFSLLFRGSLLQVTAGLQMLLSDQLTWLIRRGPRKIGCAGHRYWSAGLVELKPVQQLSCTGSSVITEVEGRTTCPMVADPCMSAKLCTCVCTMQRIWLLWRRMFAGIAVNSKEILLDLPSHLSCVMSLHVGAHGRIDRALLKKKKIQDLVSSAPNWWN